MHPSKPIRAFALSTLSAGLMLAHQSAFAATQEMDTVIISASGTEHTQMTAPAFTSVIDAEALRDNPSESVADLIGRSTGVINTTDSAGRDEVRMRGLDASYTLILVDGRRISSGNALWRGGDFDFSAVPRASIERIEIVRGPMSSLYGADAMGGVINIITKKGSQDWATNVDVVYEHVLKGEDGDQFRTNLSTAGSLTDSLYMRLSGEFYNRDAWYVNDADTVPEHEEKKARNLSGSLSWDLDERQSVNADLMINRDERPYAHYATNSFREQEIERTTYALSHAGDWDWGNTLLSLNYEDGEIDDYNSRYPAPAQRQLEEQNLTFSGTAGMNLGIHGLTMGYEYRSQEVNDKVAFTSTGGSKAIQQAVFLQDELKLTDQLRLTLGGRYDDHEDFDGEFTPRGYLVYQVSDALSIKGGVSKAFKAPRPHQLIEEYQIVSCGGSCFIPGNPDLTPETSINYELGLETRHNDWRMSAVVFRNDVEDMIAATYDEATNSRAWVNLNEVQVTGLEVEGQVSLNRTLSLDAAYTYMDTEENGDAELSYRPRHKLNAGVNWQATAATGLRLAVDYFGEQKNYSNENQPAYTLVSLSANSQVAQGLTVRGGINNLTNVDLTEDDEDYYSNVVGRSLYVGLSYDF